ncbi:MAG: hypothetical protein IH889_07860 [Planctomycetes bacterium]|nr:hypothetical protein [Planctomycetota bacterium]
MPAHVLIASVVAIVASGASPQGQESAGQPPALHWAIKLGMRVEQVNRAFPLVDRVVLVPDGATYVDELSKWSPQGRWPVLIEDDHLAPMFIRRFKPAQVVRRTSVGRFGSSQQDRQRLLEAVVVRSWGGDPSQDTLREVFARSNHTPPGLVITSVADPAWTAAIALAAGRGQPIAWLNERFGRPNQLLDPESLARMLARIDEILAEAGYPYADLGDAIDAITLCRAVAGRADVDPDSKRDEVRAITDLIGRTRTGTRNAFAGWIFGDETRCAYIAMCSVFLPRTQIWLYNTYPSTGNWRVYGVGDATAALADKGYQASAFSGDRTTSEAWLNMLPGGIATDVLVMNTKGSAGLFNLSRGRAYSGDVPVLNEPLALHLTHSWSMRSPDSLATIGGQWLARGVYAFVGAADEPFLEAFLPPVELAKRWANYVPFLIGARHFSDSGPWKVNTFGDPLMLCPPPGSSARQRVEPPASEGLDLSEHVTKLMQQAASDQTGDTIAEAIATLNLLGKDDIAIEMWRLAGQHGMLAAAARPSAGPLFRAERADDYIAAWQAMPARDQLSSDMLWHLMTPRLGPATDNDTLILMQSAIRKPRSHVDLERLAPHLTAAFGFAHTKRIILRELDDTTSPLNRKMLQRLLNKPR